MFLDSGSFDRPYQHRSETDVVVMKTLAKGKFPKPDTGFGKKECLEIDLFDSNCYISRPSGPWIEAASVLVFFLMGLLTGISAFLIALAEDLINEHVWDLCQQLIDHHYLFPAWCVYTSFALIFAGTAAALSVYVGPGAIGSGIAEIMGYLNGVNYPLLLNKSTMLVKILGVTLAVSAGLRVGKEGPLAHIGACIGIWIVYLPLGFTKYFRNDKDKRELVAAGASAGVSAAFASPIGGALFGFEISSPASFWSFSLMWKIFFACSISTFVLNFLESVKLNNQFLLINAGLIKLGKQETIPFNMVHLPFFFLFGWVCGILGAAFVFLNGKIINLRKRFLTTNGRKIAETVVLAFMTTTVVFFLPLMNEGKCQKLEGLESKEIFRQYTCEEGEYNGLASLFFNTEGQTIKIFF